MVAGVTQIAASGRRFAAHMGIWDPSRPLLAASAGSTDPLDQIACAARLGFAGVSDNMLLLRSATEQRHMGHALLRHGLAMGSFTFNPRLHDAPFYWGQPIADLSAAVAPALEAGARVGGGCINAILLDDGTPRETQLAHAAENLHAAAAMAAQAGLRLAVEAISRTRVPTSLLDSAAQTARLVREADGENLGLILDSCHCHCTGEDMAALLRGHHDILAAVQLADMPGRVEPGAGQIDFAPILAALDAIGWQGLLEAEFDPALPGIEGEARAMAALSALGGEASP